MRRAATLLLVFAAVLLAMAAGAWLAAANGWLTRPLAAWAGGQLGRAIAFDGGLRIRVGGLTRISADGLRLANVPWGSRPDMFTARTVTLELETRSLLEETLVIHDARIEGADLLLERSPSGEDNWSFAPRPDEPPGAALPVVIGRLALPGARIRLAGPPLAQPLDVALAAAEQSLAADGTLTLAVRGEANGTPLDLRLAGGSFAGLVAGRDIRFDLAGRIGEVALRADGRIDSLHEPVDTAVRLRVDGPDAAGLAARLGLRDLGAGPFDLDGVVTPAPGGAGLRAQLHGRVGGFTGSARGFLDVRGEPATLGVQAKVAGPDLSLAGALAGVPGLPVEPFELRLDARRQGAELRVGDAELAVAEATLAFAGSIGTPDGTLDVRLTGTDLARLGERFGLPGLPRGAFDVSGKVLGGGDGAPRVKLSGTTPVGRVAADGTLGTAPGLAGSRLGIEADGADFRPLGRLAGLGDPPAGRFGLRGTVAWTADAATLGQLRLGVAGASLRLDGTVARAPGAVGTRLRFDLQGPDARRDGLRLGVEGLPAGAYRVAGGIRRERAMTRLDKVQVTLAGATLRLDGAWGDAPAYRGTRVAFDAAGPALERFAGLAPGTPLPTGTFSAAGTLERAGARIRLRDLRAAAADATGTGSAEFTLPLSAAPLGFTVDAKGADLAALLPQLQDDTGAGRNFVLGAKGSLAGDQWSFESLRLKTDTGSLELAGSLALEPRLATTGLTLAARTASLRALGRLAGRAWPDEPVDVRARFTGTGADFDLEELDARIGDSDLRGRMAVRLRKGLQEIDARIESRRLDLRPFIGQLVERRQATARSRRGDRTLVVPQLPLGLAALDGYGGRLELRAGELRLAEGTFRDLRVQGTLGPRRLHLERIAFGDDAGAIDARIELEEGPRGVSARIAGTGRNLALAPIPIGAPGPDAARFGAEVDLRGTGRDLRELAGTLTGTLRLVGQGGRIANTRLLSASDDFLAQLFTSLNPMTKREPATEVVCVAYLLTASDGIVKTEPALVMRTAGLDIISHGSVDLHTEKIDFNFKTAARKGLGIGMAQLVNPYIKVTGRLASPALTLDPRGAVINGGAAFVTAGLSIVATTAWERVFREKDPCGAAVAGTLGGTGLSMPTVRRPGTPR